MPTPRSASRARTVGLAITLGSSIEFGDDVPVCPCCGDERLRKIGEDVTETLELTPRQWKVIAHVREKFSCRALRGHHASAGAAPSLTLACRSVAVGAVFGARHPRGHDLGSNLPRGHIGRRNRG